MIGVFDSGIGGLTILDEIVKRLPQYDYIYYGDGKNNPYGEKSEEELMTITTNIVRNLKARGCKLIVIACNTATTRCMKKLRELFPDLIFVGTVPAIKVACDKNFKKTLVMATPATIESERTNELVKDNIREDQEIYLVPCFGLANAIERKDQDEINQLLKDILKDYMDKDIDSVVLGCTHYPYIKKEISSFLPNAELSDGSVGVAKEVEHQLQLHDITSTKEKGTVRILDSLED
ncbi:MAG: glutamate racemase [Bacilli bacterium]|nr:glutamate racemase [Bacilli bacterium]